MVNGSLGNPDDSAASFSVTSLYILPTLSLLIFVGNLLVLLAIKTFKTRRVPDVLIGSLALIDILNNFIPVLISIVVFNLDHSGFRGLDNDPLCHFYNWSATWLRLSACFIASLMALDRFLASVNPFFYRTTVTSGLACGLVCGAVVSAAFVAAWPSMGWGEVKPFRGICSFDFAGGFAYVIALTGYLQLVLVLACFVSVAWKINQHVKRVHAMQLGLALTLQGGKLNIDQSATRSRDDARNKRARFAGNAGTSKSTNQEGVHLRGSRQFVKVLAVVVFLFYLSWMPIILSITIVLITNKPSEVLQSLSAMMSLVGSILNPVVYGAMCKPYRTGYLDVLRTICCCRRDVTNVRRIVITGAASGQ